MALPWVLRFYSSNELAGDTDAAGQQQTMLGAARNSIPMETSSISSLAAIRFLTAERTLIGGGGGAAIYVLNPREESCWNQDGPYHTLVNTGVESAGDPTLASTF